MNVDRMIMLDEQKIHFSPASVVDDFGRVFFYDGRVFRAVNDRNKKACQSFLESSFFKELVDKQFIPRTWISEFQIKGSELVLEHEKIFESKPHHWSFTRYKDAALFIFELNSLCNQHGYALKDAHPFNVFFKRNKPIFIDLGSIVKTGHYTGWSPAVYEEFVSTFFIPLLLWSRAEYFMARRLIEDGVRPALRTIPMNKVIDSAFTRPLVRYLFSFELYYRKKLLSRTDREHDLLRIGTRGINKVVSSIFGKGKRAFSYAKILRDPDVVKRDIAGLPRPSANSTWGSYHNKFAIGKDIVSTPRFDRIIQLVARHAPDSRTALDLAGNQGGFSYLLSQHFQFERIVLTDYDENAIDKAYRTFKEQAIPIEAYLFNFMKPLKTEEIDLFKSDIVFTLAVTHHLLLTQKYVLPVILDRIRRFSNKYVVIEFMPLGLWSPGLTPDVPGWYNVDWFRSEFSSFFDILAEEQLADNRITFVGRKLTKENYYDPPAK